MALTRIVSDGQTGVDRGANTGALVSVFGGLVQIVRRRGLRMRGSFHFILQRLRSNLWRLRMS